jgi:hypothetical protein
MEGTESGTDTEETQYNYLMDFVRT